jgi:hypothetical protein
METQTVFTPEERCLLPAEATRLAGMIGNLDIQFLNTFDVVNIVRPYFPSVARVAIASYVEGMLAYGQQVAMANERQLIADRLEADHLDGSVPPLCTGFHWSPAYLKAVWGATLANFKYPKPPRRR